jgi:hypothetical protein
MRGRGNNNNNNNNNRKGPNPLTRSYESNGPDVKIRGSAQQVAEKYTTLARDAQSAGDRVMAENYLQHAEHYNRIIAAAMAQQAMQQQRDFRDESDEDGDEEAVERENIRPERQERQPQPAIAAEDSPQPVIEGVPAEVAFSEEQPVEKPRVNGEATAHVNGTSEQAPAEEAAAAEEPAPRKTRRPRRPRRETQPDTAPTGEAETVSQD